MKLKNTEYTTKTYEITDCEYPGFYMDFTKMGNSCEFYLYCRGYAIKNLLLGICPIDGKSDDELLKEALLAAPDAIRLYMEDAEKDENDNLFD